MAGGNLIESITCPRGGCLSHALSSSRRDRGSGPSPHNNTRDSSKLPHNSLAHPLIHCYPFTFPGNFGQCYPYLLLPSTMPSVPLSVSSQSRKKLKASAFDERLLGDDSNKENQTSENAPGRVEQDQIGDNEVASPQQPNAPHTPAVRIPIEDLIANTEDAYNCAPPLATPIDHVRWQSHPDASDPSGAAGATQGSRKRTHSSSPASSDLLSAQRDALNMDTLHKSLRTPNNDPTQDLWNRYTTNNGLEKDLKESVLPAYAHLLPSSPQTPSSNGRDSGMRRTHSCGVEWPTSKSKRRKLDEQHSRTKELFAASRKDILRHDLPNNTKVGLLLDKIQESLARRVDDPDSPSSSSPLPDRHSQSLISPTKPLYKSRVGSQGPRGASASSRKASPLKKTSSLSTSFSSDFSDDLFDADTIECVDQILAQTQVRNGASTTLLNVAENTLAEAISSQSQHRVRFVEEKETGEHSPQTGFAKPAPVEITNPTITSFDEFDDDDDEDLMNEMVDLAAQYDSQGPSVAADDMIVERPTSQANMQSKHLETLDEFDDAFGDDDDLWEDIANATQKGRTPVGPKDHVCFT